MLVSFLLGAAAGWGAGFAEDHVRHGLCAALGIEPGEVSAIEMRSITLIIVLFAAALLSWILGSGGAVSLMFGATLGVLVPRLKELLRAARMPDYDS
ncbi:MAG: hypothetical protein OIF48_08210 [Silicimonas sp.]|nr:hypothetical protein [Silicimonas sp.]